MGTWGTLYVRNKRNVVTYWPVRTNYVRTLLATFSEGEQKSRRLLIKAFGFTEGKPSVFLFLLRRTSFSEENERTSFSRYPFGELCSPKENPFGVLCSAFGGRSLRLLISFGAFGPSWGLRPRHLHRFAVGAPSEPPSSAPKETLRRSVVRPS